MYCERSIPDGQKKEEAKFESITLFRENAKKATSFKGWKISEGGSNLTTSSKNETNKKLKLQRKWKHSGLVIWCP